jgi:hypothetical protein
MCASLDRRSTPRALFLSALALAAAACNVEIIGGGGVGGGLGNGGSTSSGGVTTGASSSGSIGSSSGTSGGSACSNPAPIGLPQTACTPGNPTCDTHGSVCLATAHAHGAPVFGLRIAHFALTAPKAFTTGIVQSVFNSSTSPSLPACGVQGAASFNWIFRFDETIGSVTVGAAKPVADPSTGYAFIDGVMELGGAMFAIKPAHAKMSLDAGCGLTIGASDVDLPFFQDVNANTFTILPMRSVTFQGVHVTPDHDCIGAYNATGLDPANACLPDETHPAFLDGGQIDAFIPLEAADLVLVPPLGQTLCVLLSGDASLYGDGGQPQKCKRDTNGQIVFQGDWCETSNGPAQPGCANAVRFSGSFAASGVAITN